MRAKFLVVFSLALPSIFLGRAALAYHFDTHICFNPLGVVDDARRIDTAISSFKEEAGSKPGVRELDPATCCRVVPDRSTPEYGIYFSTVLMGRQSKFVEVKPDPAGGKPYYIRTDVCGNYLGAN